MACMLIAPMPKAYMFVNIILCVNNALKDAENDNSCLEHGK